ncbi:hypothetical protein [Methanopyrus sp.]
MYYIIRSDDRCEAVAEATLPGTRYRVDLLVVGDRPVVLEAKRPGVGLREHREQAMKYVRVLMEVHLGVRPAAVVTNFEKVHVRTEPGSEWTMGEVRGLRELAEILMKLASR